MGVCEILADPLFMLKARAFQRVDVSVINAQIINALNGRINDVTIFNNDVNIPASVRPLMGNGIPITAINQKALDSGFGCTLIYDVSLSGYYHITFFKSVSHCQIDFPG